MSPDYTGVTVPPNIAPLNFVLKETPGRYHVRLYAARGKPLELDTRNQQVRFPERAWHELLEANAGGPLFLEIRRDRPGAPLQFLTVTNQIAAESIDDHLVYRLLKPLYNLYVNVGIYQRDLRTFSQSEVLANTRFERGCLNCHTFLKNRSETMALHARTEHYGLPMLIHQDGQTRQIAKPMGYLSWHPSGRYLAFSSNKLSLFFHTMGENRDVYDAASDVGLYDVVANTIVMPPQTANPKRQETWPSWSPDGLYLYFCSAPKLDRQDFKRILYDLVRVPFVPKDATWGEPETMVAASQTHLSASQPRVSPDGRYLIFTLSPYGSFPIYHAESDLYLLDLNTRQHRRMELNSDRADTWHCWSSNGRWIVFSSKRRDGLFTRPHFSYFDPAGHEHKPFILPQEDPTFYDSCLQTFNVPELIQGPVAASPRELARAIVAPLKKLVPQDKTPRPPSATQDETQSQSAMPVANPQ